MAMAALLRRPSTFTVAGAAAAVFAAGMSSRRLPHRFRRSHRMKPEPLDSAAVTDAIASLPRRFTPEDVAAAIAGSPSPLLTLPLLSHFLHSPRFRPHPSPFLAAARRLFSARLDLSPIISLSLSYLPSLPSPLPLFRSLIYFLLNSRPRRLPAAVHVFTALRSSSNPEARPDASTYHLLFTALLAHGKGDSYTHYLYMDVVRCLFRRMIDDGIPPDTRALNALIKGYAMSLHLNDALRLFHQMGPVYDCEPDAWSYGYLVRGLAMQGRTRNAMELYEDMRKKGFVLGVEAGNALVGALALNGEVEMAEQVMWELADKGTVVDDIARRAVVEEMCRRGMKNNATKFVNEMSHRRIASRAECRELIQWIEKEFGIDNLAGSSHELQLGEGNKS